MVSRLRSCRYSLTLQAAMAIGSIDGKPGTKLEEANHEPHEYQHGQRISSLASASVSTCVAGDAVSDTTSFERISLRQTGLQHVDCIDRMNPCARIYVASLLPPTKGLTYSFSSEATQAAGAFTPS